MCRAAPTYRFIDVRVNTKLQLKILCRSSFVRITTFIHSLLRFHQELKRQYLKPQFRLSNIYKPTSHPKPRSRSSVVIMETTLRADAPGFEFPQGQAIFIFSKTSIPASYLMGTRVKRPGREVSQSPPSLAPILRMSRAVLLLPLYVFKAWAAKALLLLYLRFNILYKPLYVTSLSDTIVCHTKFLSVKTQN